MLRRILTTPLIAATSAIMLSAPQADAATYDVLWWDSTPEYGGQAADSLRQEMSDYLDAYDGGSVFNSTYVSALNFGALALELAANMYDVIVFDATGGNTFDGDDLGAVADHYSSGKDNLMFDGNLYVRNIEFSPETVFPGPNGAMAGYTVNQITALAQAGGGILVGTDHDCCQSGANAIIDAVLPGAGFTNDQSPSTDGVFYGDILLNGPEAIAASDVLAHWSSVPSQGVAATGTYTDINGNSVELNSLVDVAPNVGGTKFSFVSTNLAIGGGTTDVDDTTTGGNSGGGDAMSPVPLPAAGWMLIAGLGGLAAMRRRKLHA